MVGLALRAQTYCEPQTQQYCCGYGILSVTLPGVTHPSGNASEGYQDFTSVVSTLTEGNPPQISIATGGDEPNNIRVWIDVDNNGVFDHPAELVFEALNAVSPSGVMNLPANIPVNMPLRLRVMQDFVGSELLPCTNPGVGQAEDYSFVVLPAGQIPTAGFSATRTFTCNGVAQFIQQSTGGATHFTWDFGDGHTSTDESPAHLYTQDGFYDITLIAANSQGADTLTQNGYIHVALSEACDTFAVPDTGTLSILYTCRYVLTDNGRMGNYTDHTHGILSLSPVGAEQVCLRFTEFHFETEFDYLEIYDGATPAAPLLDRYSGTQLPPDVCSSGPALCLKQVSDDVVNYSGFVAQAACQMGIAENPSPTPQLYPNPFNDGFHITIPANLGEAWTLTLVTLTGQTVYSQYFPAGTASTVQVWVPEIAAGVYGLCINGRSIHWQQKLVKVK